MRVDPNRQIPERPSGTEEITQKSTNSAAENVIAGSSASASDTAQLSFAQGRVQALVAQVVQTPEVLQEKVAALSRAVSQGSYVVTPEQTADAMISQLQLRAAA